MRAICRMSDETANGFPVLGPHNLGNNKILLPWEIMILLICQNVIPGTNTSEVTKYGRHNILKGKKKKCLKKRKISDNCHFKINMYRLSLTDSWWVNLKCIMHGGGGGGTGYEAVGPPSPPPTPSHTFPSCPPTRIMSSTTKTNELKKAISVNVWIYPVLHIVSKKQNQRQEINRFSSPPPLPPPLPHTLTLPPHRDTAV